MEQSQTEVQEPTVNPSAVRDDAPATVAASVQAGAARCPAGLRYLRHRAGRQWRRNPRAQLHLCHRQDLSRASPRISVREGVRASYRQNAGHQGPDRPADVASVLSKPENRTCCGSSASS
jgi:hypothetical protein